MEVKLLSKADSFYSDLKRTVRQRQILTYQMYPMELEQTNRENHDDYDEDWWCRFKGV